MTEQFNLTPKSYPNRYYCCIAGMKERQYLFIKIYLSSLLSRKGRMAVRERQRDRDTKDCYHWHCVGIYSEPYFCSSAGSHCPPLLRVVLKIACPVYSLTTFRISESLCELWISCPYILFLTPTHFPYGFQFTWFLSAVPLFTQVYILFRNLKLTCYQRLICNTPTLHQSRLESDENKGILHIF